MSYYPFTNVPNIIFDKHLPHLGYAELKVLLVIIRQTYGWVDPKTKTHKKFDWISGQFFSKKTGISKRAVSDAISKLIEKQLIIVKNENGKIVHNKARRRQASKLYYGLNKKASSEVTLQTSVKKSNTTIITHTKVYKEDTSLGFKKVRFNTLHLPPQEPT